MFSSRSSFWTQRVRSRLFSFHAHIDKLSKVLVEGGDWHVLSDGSGGNQTVDKMSLRSLIAVQRVEVDRHFTDLDARTGDEPSKCGGNIATWMPVEGFEYKHALCQNDRQHHNYQVTTIAGIEQLASSSGMFLVVLYQIADNQVSVDESLLAHRVP